MNDDDEILTFEEDEDTSQETASDLAEWKVLVVDDDEAVFQATKLALSDQRFDGRKIQFLYAASGHQARQILTEVDEIAVILLDVVMETEHEGLEVANWIRNTKKDPYVRIVLRTGQPGYAPEKDVIQNYDINDYKSKTELTATKLYTLLITNLRTYRDLTLSEFSRVRSVNSLLKAEIQERILAEQKLKDSEEKLLIAMNNMAGAMILVDEALEVRSFNPQFIKLFEIPPHFMKVGMAFDEFIRFRAGRGDFGPGDISQQIEEKLNEYVKSNRGKAHEEETPSGRVLEVHHGPVESGGFVAVYTDITKRKKAEGELEEARDHLQAFHDRIGSELTTAREMQSELMPNEMEVADIENRYGVRLNGYFETSSELGGDLWGVHAIDDDRFGIYTIDFSGHGVGAALNTFRCHTFLAGRPFTEDKPSEFLAQLSNELFKHLKTGQYATMLYAVIDCKNDELHYAGACNPAPIIGNIAERDFSLGDGSGLPLGLTPNQSYEDHKLPFPKDSFLFLYSDALFEAATEEQGRLDMEYVKGWVHKALAEGDKGTHLDHILKSFNETAKPPLDDDLTTVWLSR